MLPSIPVRVVALLQPGLTQTWETEVPDFSESPDPLLATTLWLWRKWGDMILPDDELWPCPLKGSTLFYRRIDGSETLEPLFPDQAQHQTPEWRLPVAGCEVSA